MSLINPEWKIEWRAIAPQKEIYNNIQIRYVEWRIVPSEIPWYLKPFVWNRWRRYKGTKYASIGIYRELIKVVCWRSCLRDYSLWTMINADNIKERNEFKNIKSQIKTFREIKIYNKNLKREIKKTIQQSKDYYLKEDAIWR